MAGRAVQLLYFAWLRERVGMAGEEIELPDGVSDVGGLITWLRARGPAWDSAFGAGGGRLVRCAVNHDFAAAEAPVKPGDEIAFFPPVTGG